MINDVQYFNTLRCNCFCGFCSARNCKSEEWLQNEAKPSDIAEALVRSKNIADDVYFWIAGGEPFLMRNLEDIVIPVLKKYSKSRVAIFTNGTDPKELERFAKAIPTELRPRVFVRVSIDGLPQVHNSRRRHKRAYELALESLKISHDNGLDVNVNTIVFPDVVSGFEQFQSEIARCGDGRANIECSVNWVDTVIGDKFPYSDEEILSIAPIVTPRGWTLKYLTSKGDMCLKDCQAAQTNCAIAPNGDLYTCYAAKFERNQDGFCMGNILRSGFDTVWNNRNRYGALDNVCDCIGCMNPSDMDREVRNGNFDYSLSYSEIEKYFYYFKETEYYEGFGDCELHEDGTSHRWLTSESGRVICRPLSLEKGGGTYLSISFGNMLPDSLERPPMLCSISVNDKPMLNDCWVSSREDLKFWVEPSKDGYITVAINVNQLWSPKEVFGSADTRMLGIAMFSVDVR
ncbi:MAG: radical SAM/SPASM domain-containing protein [Clostridiales bacterium]|nr:radical SAM/SPASM domain-containing protein [Clostridiales bacterium]